MKPLTYNVSLASGLLLIFLGASEISLGVALMVTGGLIIGLTLLGAYFTRGR